MKLRMVQRPNRYPIMVKIKSELYLFYPNYAFVYFNYPKQREMFTYNSIDAIFVEKEIDKRAKYGGAFVNYNEQYYYVTDDGKQTKPVDKYPTALTNEEGDIALIYSNRYELWTVTGEKKEFNINEYERLRR